MNSIECITSESNPNIQVEMYHDPECMGPHEWGDDFVRFGIIEDRPTRSNQRDWNILLETVMAFLPEWKEGDEAEVRKALIEDGLIAPDNNDDITFEYGDVFVGDKRFDGYAFRFDESDIEDIRRAVIRAGGLMETASLQRCTAWALVRPEHAKEFPQGLGSWMKEYREWADGNCYRFAVQQRCCECGEWRTIDSVGGFIGYDYALEEANNALQWYAKRHPDASESHRILHALLQDAQDYVKLLNSYRVGTGFAPVEEPQSFLDAKNFLEGKQS